jgi:hypothetical protein
VDLETEERARQEKITFNSVTNSVGPRRCVPFRRLLKGFPHDNWVRRKKTCSLCLDGLSVLFNWPQLGLFEKSEQKTEEKNSLISVS